MQAHLRGAGADHERLELRENSTPSSLAMAIGMGQMAADLCASCYDTEAGYGNCIRCWGMDISVERIDLRFPFEFVGPRCIGGFDARITDNLVDEGYW